MTDPSARLLLPVEVPTHYLGGFAYLSETFVYYFNLVQQMKTGGKWRTRLCFVTDYTLNIATPTSGQVLHCCQVKDVEEVCVDGRALVVGIRLLDWPLDAGEAGPSTSLPPRMPRDLLLRSPSRLVYQRLLSVLMSLYAYLTGGRELLVRDVGRWKHWGPRLALCPSARRARGPALRYHPRPSPAPVLPSRTDAVEEVRRLGALPRTSPPASVLGGGPPEAVEAETRSRSDSEEPRLTPGLLAGGRPRRGCHPRARRASVSTSDSDNSPRIFPVTLFTCA